jgi:hypothetical protein
MSIPKKRCQSKVRRTAEQVDLFVDSPRRPTREEREVAALISSHTRRAPILINQICGARSLPKRQAQSIIESLRAEHHLPIGASKHRPRGYFWIRDAADLEIALRNMLNPAKRMLATARAFAPPHLEAELNGQIRILLFENGSEGGLK